VLLLTALWPLGSSAGDAGQPSHAVLPAPGTAKAVGLPSSSRRFRASPMLPQFMALAADGAAPCKLDGQLITHPHLSACP